MTKETMALYAAALFAFLLVLAVLGWRRRKTLQESAFSAPLEALEFFGEQLAIGKCFYVATTLAENHLERIAAYGLGIRGEAQVLVFDQGVLLVRKGERPLAIDRSQLNSIITNQAVIDCVVEADGLLTINWVQDNTQLSTHIRAVDTSIRAALLEAISAISTREVSK